MEQILTILGVAALLLLRIGVPVLTLICIGMLINHWQDKRDASIRREVNHHL